MSYFCHFLFFGQSIRQFGEQQIIHILAANFFMLLDEINQKVFIILVVQSFVLGIVSFFANLAGYCLGYV